MIAVDRVTGMKNWALVDPRVVTSGPPSKAPRGFLTIGILDIQKLLSLVEMIRSRDTKHQEGIGNRNTVQIRPRMLKPNVSGAC